MRRLLATLLILLPAVPAALPSALPSARADDTVWAAMKAGGVYVLMRHERAPGTGDPPHFRLGDCATQRNLDDAGRAAARRTGERLRARGVEVALVLTSQWCRCRDTARALDLGPVRDAPYLNSFFADRSQSGPRTRALRQRVATPLAGGIAILVTHQVNITALTDIFPAQGELIVLRPAPGTERGFRLVGRLRP